MRLTVLHRLRRCYFHKHQRSLATDDKPKDDTAAEATKDPDAPRKELYLQKSVRVGVLGGDSYTGNVLSMLLKQNPLVSQIYLHGAWTCKGYAMEIGHIDTSCIIKAVEDETLPKALTCCDIVVMLNARQTTENTVSSIPDYMSSELARIVKLTTLCSTVAPKAMLIVAICPVSITLPIVSDIYRTTHWYHPGRVMGSVVLQQIRANSILARFNDLDPDSVHVPLTGGPEPDCMVPMFSRAMPIGVNMKDAEKLLLKFRRIGDINEKVESTCATRLESAPLAEAYGLNRMITAMALGICGDKESCISAFVRSNIIPTCNYLTSTIRFGLYGMDHNYGLPQLTPLELKLFEHAALLLRKREAMAKYYIKLAKAGNKCIAKPDFDSDMEEWLPKQKCLNV